MRQQLFGHAENLSELPTVLLMGRTNAGKSTLFNRFISKRKNIVFNEPGVTRDFLEARAQWEGCVFRLVDTAGFEPGSARWSYPEVQEGIRRILGEADVVIYLIDGTEDINPIDQDVLRDLKKQSKAVVVAINKIDSAKREAQAHVFHELGIHPLYLISSEHALGISELLDAVVHALPPFEKGGQGGFEEEKSPSVPLFQRGMEDELQSEEVDLDTVPIKVTIVGRPNVGKSTLSNALFGGERVVVSDRPGTTRDAVEVVVTHDGREFRFMDTAGIRRPGKRESDIERISIAQSLEGIYQADVVLWMVDATAGIVEQDKKVLGQILEARRPFVAIFNKWDAVIARERKMPPRQLEKNARQSFAEECPFADFAPVLCISAQKGQGIDAIFKMIALLHKENHARFSTGEVNRRMEPVIKANPPPSQMGRITKIYYTTQVRTAPPTFVFFTNHPNQVRDSYRRFLQGVIRKEFHLPHVSIHVMIRGRRSSIEE